MSSATDRGRTVAALALLALPGATPPRLHALLARFGDPERALAAVRAGHPDAATLGDTAAPPPPGRGDARLHEVVDTRGVRAWIAGDPDHPVRRAVPDPLPVLLAEGDAAEVLERPRVAIVGTRAATPSGRADAVALGAWCARAGATVVSGLALGIDGAAHEGALDAGGGAVGVVATGLDVVYPRRHRSLFGRVRAAGLLVSEVGYGTRPEPWRFPVRNRIIAALADVVVVVEATARGGARITAEHALRYDRPVLAVPGSRRNPAAAGCNALIADGAHPLLDPTDVGIALDLAGADTPAGWSDPAPPRDPVAVRVLAALAGEPATADELAVRTGLPDGAVAGALRALERAKCVTRARGLLWPT